MFTKKVTIFLKEEDRNVDYLKHMLQMEQENIQELQREIYRLWFQLSVVSSLSLVGLYLIFRLRKLVFTILLGFVTALTTALTYNRGRILWLRYSFRHTERLTVIELRHQLTLVNSSEQTDSHLH